MFITPTPTTSGIISGLSEMAIENLDSAGRAAGSALKDFIIFTKDGVVYLGNGAISTTKNIMATPEYYAAAKVKLGEGYEIGKSAAIIVQDEAKDVYGLAKDALKRAASTPPSLDPSKKLLATGIAGAVVGGGATVLVLNNSLKNRDSDRLSKPSVPIRRAPVVPTASPPALALKDSDTRIS